MTDFPPADETTIEAARRAGVDLGQQELWSQNDFNAIIRELIAMAAEEDATADRYSAELRRRRKAKFSVVREDS